AAAGQDDRQDGKDRRRHLLYGELDADGQLGAGGADAFPGKVSRLLHVGAGTEVDGQVAAATDGLGADALDADDSADGLLQGDGDLQLRVAQVEAGLPGNDGNARESDLRVDATGHARDAVDAASGQQGRQQDQSAEVRSGLRGEVEHGSIPRIHVPAGSV